MGHRSSILMKNTIICNSRSLGCVFYTAPTNVDGEETTLFVDGVHLILMGDFRKDVYKILETNPLTLKGWFLVMEKEWGSPWSHNSPISSIRDLLEEI